MLLFFCYFLCKIYRGLIAGRGLYLTLWAHDTLHIHIYELWFLFLFFLPVVRQVNWPRPLMSGTPLMTHLSFRRTIHRIFKERSILKHKLLVIPL
jgi:hypothetical protein